MQAIMNQTAGSVLDLVRRPGSIGGQDKGGKRFKDYMASSRSNRNKQSSTSVKGRKNSDRYKKEPPSPDVPEKKTEPEEKTPKVSAHGADMIALLLQGKVSLAEGNPQPTGGNGERLNLVEAFPSSVTENGVGIEANAGSGSERGLNLFTESEALLSKGVAAQSPEPENKGILPELQNSALLKGEGDIPRVPGKDGYKGTAFKFRGEAQPDGASDSTGEKGLKKAFQDVKPVQFVQQDEVSQGSAEHGDTSNSSKLTEPAAAASSGGEAEPGPGQSGNTGHMGMQGVSAKGLPTQNQDAFLGRLTQVLQDQMLAKSELLMRDGRAEIKLELKPEYLGRLFVRLSVENGAVNARFVVENHQVRNLIENNMTQLKQCLSEQGITWQDASVDVGGSGNGLPFEDGSSFSGNWGRRESSDRREMTESDFVPGAEGQYRESLISFLA